MKRAESGQPVYLESARRLATLLQTALDTLVDGPDALIAARSNPARSLAIAVLPLRPIGPDEATRYLADGMTEDLINRLGGWWFPVISRTCTWNSDALDQDVLRMCAERGVAYFVEGSTRRATNELHVAIRLVDATTGSAAKFRNYQRV